MQERLGFVLPIVGGEGGWFEGDEDDKHYPKVDWTLQAAYTREMYEWLYTGVLSNGEPLPDYLFSITAWIAGSYDYGAQNWWGNILRENGMITDTIEAMQRLPVFVRRLGWHEDGTQSPEPVETPPQETEPPATTEPGQGDGDPLPADPGVPAPPVEIETEWDARLDDLGVRLTRSTEPSSWRLVSAHYEDDAEARGTHHVYIRAENADRTPASGVRFVVDWLGRLPHENPGFTTTNAQGEGNVPIFIIMHPDKQDGIQFARAAEAPSDVVTGMGLPNNHHVSYRLTFRRQ